MEIEQEFYEYLNGPRDSKLENKFARWIRRLPDDVRHGLLRNIVPINESVALAMVRRSESDALFMRFLLHDLCLIRDASSIGAWMKVITPKIGLRSTTKVVDMLALEDPDAFRRADYWLQIVRATNKMKS